MHDDPIANATPPGRVQAVAAELVALWARRTRQGRRALVLAQRDNRTPEAQAALAAAEAKRERRRARNLAVQDRMEARRG